MKKLLIIFSAAVAAFSMSGCSTHKGAWKLAWEENFNQKEHFDTAVWSKIPRGTADWQKHMSDYFGARVKMTCTPAGRGKITIPFRNHEEMERIIAMLDHAK